MVLLFSAHFSGYLANAPALLPSNPVSLDEYAGVQAHGDGVRNFQVEIDGHGFVEQRRVAHRAHWYLRYLRVYRVLAEPFDGSSLQEVREHITANGGWTWIVAVVKYRLLAAQCMRLLVWRAIF